MAGLSALLVVNAGSSTVKLRLPETPAAAVDRPGFLGERTLVITAREDLEMARQVRALLRNAAPVT